MANELHLIADALAHDTIDFESQALNPARAFVAPRILEQVFDIDPETRHLVL
jgi:hypothetical protein